MADIFVHELGDMLVTGNMCEERMQNKLPSPNDLKGKIILKGKIKQKKKVCLKIAKFTTHTSFPLLYSKVRSNFHFP